MKVKQSMGHITVKQITGIAATVLSLLLFFVLTIWAEVKVSKLIDQQAASRWDKDTNAAQVSCYFEENIVVDELQILNFRQQFEQQLSDVLSQKEISDTGKRRLYIDAYSSMGTVTVTSEKGILENVDAVGIGGDFFLFHPLQLLSGQYFSGDDLMKDSVIVDEEAAWQLFGSNDIAGKSVMIGEVPHYIAGVIKRPTGKFAESAGLDKTVVYLSHESLTAYGSSSGISNYEITAPNPVKHFVYTAVKERLGVKENDMVVVENSSRYQPEALISVLLDFGTRSMQNAAVKFPYWENIGRGWEDVMALVLLLRFLFLLNAVIIILGYLIYRWKNRTFTGKDIWNFLTERVETLQQNVRKQKADRIKEREMEE